MTIKEMQKIYKDEASMLGDYQSMTKTELANGYCDARHASWDAEERGDESEKYYQEQIRSAYFAALMLRYWYKIWEWIKNSRSLNLDQTDFIDWLADGLWVAFYYETWRYEYKAIVKDGKFIDWQYDENGEKIPNPYYWKLDENAPDKMINRCCASIRGKYYQYWNKGKRKSEVQTCSLDALIDEDGDYATQWTGCITEDNHVFDTSYYALINAFYSKNELLEGLVIDGIVNGDSFKQEIKTEVAQIWDEDEQKYMDEEIEKSYDVFDARKLVKHLSHLDQDYIYNFCHIYDLPISAGDLIYNKLKKTTNIKLYKLIEKVQLEVQSDDSLKRLITQK